ncbi:peptidyl-prolyl cis-trans isomerase [Sphingobium phenoxybenzoativorans]|uniref:Parvulin-like PPIase n=1 Tax=Sphingobium phenoxybenzoativorans TaxID=1592790 RepID=A0A975Q1R5_9SPHN|nr:peptidyl-prolyl cis-trans isomerase [Sphingobium phenoxybenzoativorans]QUT05653.1 peptidyl-prolyl cis-trans isomerase [Sphingobium phenoxybenzoativorans]
MGKLIRSRAMQSGCIIAACFLASCGSKKVPDQTIVTGDNFEITLTELDQILRAAPPVQKEQVAPARRAILDTLISQKLLAEAGEEAGLDKQVQVVQAIEAAKRSILAQAYARKLVGEDDAPSEAAIRKYYDDHPEKFSRRLKLNIVEYSVPQGFPNINEYAALLDKEGFDALSTKMAADSPDTKQLASSRLSSELPPTAAKILSSLKPGSDISYATPGQVHLGRVQTIEIDPQSFEEAKFEISEAIKSERREQTVAAAVQELRKSRHIEIVNKDLKVQAR